MASGFYNSALYEIARANVDLDGDTLKLMLLGTANGGYTYDADHVFVEEAANDANEEELTGVSGYTGGSRRSSRRSRTTPAASCWRLST